MRSTTFDADDFTNEFAQNLRERNDYDKWQNEYGKKFDERFSKTPDGMTEKQREQWIEQMRKMRTTGMRNVAGISLMRKQADGKKEAVSNYTRGVAAIARGDGTWSLSSLYGDLDAAEKKGLFDAPTVKKMKENASTLVKTQAIRNAVDVTPGITLEALNAKDEDGSWKKYKWLDADKRIELRHDAEVRLNKVRSERLYEYDQRIAQGEKITKGELYQDVENKIMKRSNADRIYKAQFANPNDLSGYVKPLTNFKMAVARVDKNNTAAVSELQIAALQFPTALHSITNKVLTDKLKSDKDSPAAREGFQELERRHTNQSFVKYRTLPLYETDDKGNPVYETYSTTHKKAGQQVLDDKGKPTKKVRIDVNGRFEYGIDPKAEAESYRLYSLAYDDLTAFLDECKAKGITPTMKQVSERINGFQATKKRMDVKSLLNK